MYHLRSSFHDTFLAFTILCLLITKASAVRHNIPDNNEYCNEDDHSCSASNDPKSPQTTTISNDVEPHCTLLAIGVDSIGHLNDLKVLSKYMNAMTVSYKDADPFRNANDDKCVVRLFLEWIPLYIQSINGDLIRDGYIVHDDWIAPLKEEGLNSGRIWFMPNIDLMDQVSLFHPGLELILCKTRQCVDWIDSLRKIFALDVPIMYTGFTTEAPIMVDVDNRNVQRDYSKFLHSPGKSGFKGTLATIMAWKQNPHFPKLTLKTYHNDLVNHIISKGLRLSDNIEHIDEIMSREEYNVMLYEHGVHVCASDGEGFGHYINEARAIGAAVITSDYPPMNEMFRNRDTAVLSKPLSSTTAKNGMPIMFQSMDGKELAEAVEEMLSKTEQERMRMGQLANIEYRKDKEAFQKRAKSVRCMLGLLFHNIGSSVQQLAEQCGISLE